jgi:hypothetical protein
VGDNPAGLIRKMSKYFKRYLIIVLVVFLVFGLLSIVLITQQSSFPKHYEKAYKEYKRLISRAPEVSKAYADDIEIQLGLVYLYSWLGTPVHFVHDVGKNLNREAWINEHRNMLASQFEKAHSLDPNRRTLWAQRAYTDLSNLFNGERVFLFLLRRRIASAQREGLEKVNIQLKRWSDKGWVDQDEELVLEADVEDINTVPEPVRAMFENEMLKVIPTLEQIQQRVDPNNGLYNYFRAAVYFETGMEEKAISEVRAALEKEYYESYDTQLLKAANTTLKAIGVSTESINLLQGSRGEKPISSWIHQIVIKERLEKIFGELRMQGDLKKASDIEKLFIDSRKQISFMPTICPETSQF